MSYELFEWLLVCASCFGDGLPRRYNGNAVLLAPFAPYKFPVEYHGAMLIASRGRGSLQWTGYPLPRVLAVRLDGSSEVAEYRVFADRWQEPMTTERVGRPQDVEVMADGSVLVSDEMRGAIFRITYDSDWRSNGGGASVDGHCCSGSDVAVDSEGDCWSDLEPLPVALGEVSAAVIEGVLYVVGQGESGGPQRNSDTFGYPLDSAPSGWSRASPRIRGGNHHSSVVVEGEWWLIGGIDDGSAGSVQIYSAVHNVWRLGPSLPWPTGSACVAVVRHWLFVCGGIIENKPNADYTQSGCAFLDVGGRPQRWSTAMSPMPMGRNHAATATDGERMYIFGGRSGGNSPADGFDDVQIYDPVGDRWKTDKSDPEEVASLPVARGGMGAAVFYEGRFYIFGGETSTDLLNAGPLRTYDRVDIYDPVHNQWAEGQRMTTPRHGVYPVAHRDAIYLAGGGIKSSNSQSAVFDAYCPPKRRELDTLHCCRAMRAPNWNGRCWPNTNELDCEQEPRAQKRCYWDPTNCLSAEPNCSFHGEHCLLHQQCCSGYCRTDSGQCR